MNEEAENSGQQLEQDIDILCGVEEKKEEKEEKKKGNEECSGSGSSPASSKE